MYKKNIIINNILPFVVIMIVPITPHFKVKNMATNSAPMKSIPTFLMILAKIPFWQQRDIIISKGVQTSMRNIVP